MTMTAASTEFFSRLGRYGRRDRCIGGGEDYLVVGEDADIAEKRDPWRFKQWETSGVWIM